MQGLLSDKGHKQSDLYYQTMDSLICRVYYQTRGTIGLICTIYQAQAV
jgi:hypothetical protein